MSDFRELIGTVDNALRCKPTGLGSILSVTCFEEMFNPSSAHFAMEWPNQPYDPVVASIEAKRSTHSHTHSLSI